MLRAKTNHLVIKLKSKSQVGVYFANMFVKLTPVDF